MLLRLKAILRAARRLLRRAALPLLGRPILVEVTEHDTKFLVDPTADPGWNLLRGRSYEPHKLRAAQAVIGPDDVLLDLGASFGYYTVQLASQVRHVLAVEPAPRSCRLLRANVALNGLTNVDVVEAAVGRQEGTATLQLTGDESFSTLGETNRDLVLNRRQVALLTVAQLVERAPAPPTVYKVDTEGAERDILLGAEEVLCGERGPAVILMEVDPRNTRSFGYEPSVVFEMMEEWGFRAVDLAGQQVGRITSHSTSDLPEEVVFLRRGSDRADRAEKRMKVASEKA